MIRLEDVIDIQTWIEPFLVEKITGMKNSLQFLITKDDTSPSSTKVLSKPDSGSTAYEDTNLLRGLPVTKPMFKAGRRCGPGVEDDRQWARRDCWWRTRSKNNSDFPSRSFLASCIFLGAIFFVLFVASFLKMN